MNQSLFRQQAIAHQKNSLHGDVLVVPSLSHTFFIAFILTWLTALFFWLFNSHYSRKEAVIGWLEPSSGVVKVYSQDDLGKISHVLITEGQHVVKGQPLVDINGDRTLANGMNLQEKILSEYQSQKKLFTQQLKREDIIYKKKQVDIMQQIAASKSDLSLIENQLTILNERHKLIQKKVKKYKKIQVSGDVSANETNNIIEQELILRSDQQSLMRSKTNQLNTIEQLQAEQQLQPEEYQNSIDKIKTNLSDLTQKTLQLQGQKSHVIRAPRSGTVSSLQAKIGQQTRSSMPLLSIVPDDAHILANLLIPVRAAGFVKKGQSLEIRYDAFPYQKFGLYSGEIQSISDSIILPAELNNSSIEVREPVYLVKAKLNSSYVSAFGQKMKLKSGMTLSADIKLDNRTLVQWLLEPLLSLKGRL